jgi:hypothetical protein
MQSPTSSRGGWGLYYSHWDACSRDYKYDGRGEVPKSLELIEASANIKRLSGELTVRLCVLLVCPSRGTLLPYLYTKGMLHWSLESLYSKERCLGALQADVMVHCIVDLCPLVSYWEPRKRPRGRLYARALGGGVSHTVVVVTTLRYGLKVCLQGASTSLRGMTLWFPAAFIKVRALLRQGGSLPVTPGFGRQTECEPCTC